jgi:hypothetical protein
MKAYLIRYAVIALAMVLIVLGSTRVLAGAGRQAGNAKGPSLGLLFQAGDEATETQAPAGTEVTETDEPEETETEEASETPEPTGTQGPSETPEMEEEGELEGVVEQISASAWVIAGRTFLITGETEIEGGISVGDTVEVEFFVDEQGNLTAHEIEAEAEDDDDDDDEDDDDHDDEHEEDDEEDDD